MRRAQRMFFASSKRAFSSTSTVTCLPFSAAVTSAARDRGVLAGPVQRLLDGEHARSRAACSRKSTTLSNESKGGAAVRRRRGSSGRVSPARATRGGSARRSAAPSSDRRLEIDELGQARDVSPGRRIRRGRALRGSRTSRSSWRRRSPTGARTSSRTGSPRRRRRSSCSIAISRFSGLFFVDVEVRIARHAEGGVIEDLGAREEFGELPAITSARNTYVRVPASPPGARKTRESTRGTCTTASRTGSSGRRCRAAQRC